MKSNKKWQFKEEALLLQQQERHLEHYIQCPTAHLEMHESLKMTWRKQALKSDGTKTPFSFRISALQTSLLIIPRLFVDPKFDVEKFIFKKIGEVELGKKNSE